MNLFVIHEALSSGLPQPYFVHSNFTRRRLLDQYTRPTLLSSSSILFRTMASLWTQDTKSAINLGKGHPNPAHLALDDVQAAVQKVAAADGAAVTLMQYGRMQGPEPLCESISEWIATAADDQSRVEKLPKPSDILITTGSGPGMSIVAQLFSKPGDMIFVDSPGYFLSYFTFADCNLDVVNIPTDEHGIDVDKLQQLLEEGKVPSLVYTVPIGNNPTGVSMSEDRKRRLVELAQKYNFKILSDEVYQFLTFGTDFPTSLFEYDDPSNPTVFAVNSFSKILGPGLRLGWIATHPSHMSRILDCGPLHSGGGFNPFMGTVVDEMIRSGFVQQQVSKLCAYYKENSDIMCQAIDDYIVPAVADDEKVTYFKPTGGFFCFITLPQRFDTTKLLQTSAKDSGVSYFAGCNSSPDKNSFHNCIRLCFAFLERDQIVEGVKRVGNAIQMYADAQ